jgi:hypothetical protein
MDAEPRVMRFSVDYAELGIIVTQSRSVRESWTCHLDTPFLDHHRAFHHVVDRCLVCLTVAPYLRRETNTELQATNIYSRPGHDPDAPDAASGASDG